MVSQQEFINHYYNLYKNNAVYVWGANGEIITKELTDRLYRTYGSATFDKDYYNNKFKTGQGKIGCDCSGSIYPLSKSDNTAKGYYNLCPKRGVISSLNRNVACLIFNSSFTHVGAYVGNGISIEMMNSIRNCVKQNFNKSRWAFWGIPSWLDTKTNVSSSSSQIDVKPSVSNTSYSSVIANVQKWCNSFCNSNIEVDGIQGKNTIKALCKALQHYHNLNYDANLDEDGSFGPLTKNACKQASGKTKLVYIAQAMLFIRGYDMSHSIIKNNLDSSYGPGTKATVLKFQQDTRGLVHDGLCGPATFYALFN